MTAIATEATTWARCQRCGLVLRSRAGDESGPIARLLEHRRREHQGVRIQLVDREVAK